MSLNENATLRVAVARRDGEFAVVLQQVADSGEVVRTAAFTAETARSTAACLLRGADLVDGIHARMAANASPN
ncbi:hypothetical protein QWZ03_18115 [Chitinimonas viridis]|uniref:DUF1508 domain-containing protein n=1 Tax=Chitinimonas viridis TaxID=664880 RepID=A0ABT8B9H9_9NEIS|nr:hypothetical protein [Chitinimonas viridis]MDN3578685.1 hypothetical protein [Chitinimonas viridis]